MRVTTKVLGLGICGVLIGAPAYADRGDKPAGMNNPSGTQVDVEHPYAGQSLRPMDRKFVEKAASGSLAEVKMGELALEKGQSKVVKTFAQKMVDDHRAAGNELLDVAQRKHFMLPTSVDTDHQAVYDRLAKLSGSDFDEAYMKAMVKDHDEDVKLFSSARDNLSDPDVKAWAMKTMMTIQGHDDMAHKDLRNMR